VVAMSESFVKVTIRLPRSYDSVIRELVLTRNCRYSEVVRDFIRKNIEGTSDIQPDFTPAKVIEVIYCQHCGEECTTGYQPVKFRDDVFKFCMKCFSTEVYKETLSTIAKTYAY
jgi:hypothetical protein